MILPLDIISRIVKYLPYADICSAIIALCPGVETESMKKIKNEISNPNIFFEDIVSEVPYFIELMQLTGAMLIGLRAFSYFHLIDISEKIPWIFTCPNNKECWVYFVDHMSSKGVEWNSIRTARYMGVDYCMNEIKGRLFANGKVLKIVLLWSRDLVGTTSNIIEGTCMSPLQCMISGFSAVDPYGKLHAKKMYRLWGKSHKNKLNNIYLSPSEAIECCEKHSIVPVTYEIHRNYAPSETFKPIRRSLMGVDSFHTRFSILHPQKFVRFDMITILESVFKLTVMEHIINIEYDKLNTFLKHNGHIHLPNLEYELRHLNDTTIVKNSPDWISNEKWIEIVVELVND